MLEQKLKDWLKKEMVMSKVSDQIQIKTCIYNNEKVTYAFVGGLPVKYCYFVGIMLSTYTSAGMIPHEDYYKIIDILHEEWKDVVDLTYYKKKYKKHMGDLLREEELYTKQFRNRQTAPSLTKSIVPMFALKQELKAVRSRQTKRSPELNSLDTIRVIVENMENIYEASYNDPVIL